MILLKIIMVALGIIFNIFGYFIYFKKKYNLINGFKADYKAGRKTELYAKKIGMGYLIIGVILVVGAICLIIIK